MGFCDSDQYTRNSRPGLGQAQQHSGSYPEIDGTFLINIHHI